MAFCSNCGATLSPTARFCKGCGAQVIASTQAVPQQQNPGYGQQAAQQAGRQVARAAVNVAKQLFEKEVAASSTAGEMILSDMQF